MSEEQSVLRRLFDFNGGRERERGYGFIFFVILICAATALSILISPAGEVLRDYFYYGDALFNGVLPYEPYNDLNWEYPPLAYLFLLVPRLFASDPAGYQVAYIMMIGLFLIVGLWFVRELALRHNKNANLFMLFYFLTAMLLWQFTYDRFDMIVAVITIAAIYFYIEKKYPLAFLLIAIGMFVKLYPGLLLPVFLIPFIASRDLRGTLRGVGVFLISSVLMIVPFVIWSPDTFMTFVQYHTERGVQIESVTASLILMLEIFGFTSTQTDSQFWSHNLDGGLADAVASFVMPLMIVMLLLFCAIHYLSCRKEEDIERRFMSVGWASLGILLVFIVFNKVFSAQYMLWILTLAIPMMACMEDRERTRKIGFLIVVCAIVTMYFGLMYTGLRYHEPFAIMMLFIRNMMVVTLLVVTLHYSGVLGTIRKTLRRTA